MREVRGQQCNKTIYRSNRTEQNRKNLHRTFCCFVFQITSQHPYAEAIGEPYVWMVDMYNLTDVERALTGILKQNVHILKMVFS